jgi:hypothetical protein
MLTTLMLKGTPCLEIYAHSLFLDPQDREAICRRRKAVASQNTREARAGLGRHPVDAADFG